MEDWKKGYELIRESQQQAPNTPYTHRVILMSDGLANKGVTDKTLLSKICKKQLNEHGISVSTMGVGEGYDEKLMTAGKRKRQLPFHRFTGRYNSNF